METDTTNSRERTRRLTCTCCGEFAGRFRQHWNQDDGYGICRKCVLWMKSPARAKHYPGDEEFAKAYGTEGTNYANAEQWKKILLET